jgi:hypothetical protein
LSRATKQIARRTIKKERVLNIKRAAHAPSQKASNPTENFFLFGASSFIGATAKLANANEIESAAL